ncbi:MAG: hypothetical protein KUG78_17825 [Kangiellaceae bacterium]|nr:hypothetical protein [Kangiellaceae bacterium]
MKWYTQDDGLICLGTDCSKLANFHVVTDVKAKSKIDTLVSESHIALIGSFPEDWRSDKLIAQKINNAAKHFFGLSDNLKVDAVA